MLRHCMVGVLLLSFVAFSFAAAGDGRWLSRVPKSARTRVNPFAKDPTAVIAGAKLFQDNCAQCHGKNEEGKGRRPSLRSPRVQHATPGQLQWLLKNGSMRNGMPSWARLPEQQRWQIVAFLKSLN
jgi:mono/diheme cytochrome c family protein